MKTGALLLALLVMASMTEPGLAHQDQAPASEHGKTDDSQSCHLGIHVTEEAEQRVGGAHYHGMMPRLHKQHGATNGQMTGSGAMSGSSAMAGHDAMTGHGEMAGHDAMAGTHMDHKPRHGGAFFMAPNKLHHLEALYSNACGLQVVFYNAFTQPIRVDRFRGFARAIPKDEDEPEVLRFLSASSDRTVLAASFGADISWPFVIDLLIAFPDSEDPRLFTVHVPASQ